MKDLKEEINMVREGDGTVQARSDCMAVRSLSCAERIAITLPPVHSMHAVYTFASCPM